MAAITVFASFYPHAQAVPQLRSLLEGMLEPTRGEPGNEVYDLYRGTGEDPSFHLFERYRDAAALEAHRSSAHYKAYRAELPELLARPIEVAVLEAEDVASVELAPSGGADA